MYARNKSLTFYEQLFIDKPILTIVKTRATSSQIEFLILEARELYSVTMSDGRVTVCGC
jgi:hypothetical protein